MYAKLAAEADCQKTAQLGSKGDSTLTTAKNGQDTIHIAASTRWGDDVGFIMEHCLENGSLGLFLDQYDEDGHKSFHAACSTVQSHESVRLLVEEKLKLDGRDGAGYTPLDTCKQLPAEHVVENNLESSKASTGFRYGLRQHGMFGESQPNGGGQMMEIRYLLGQARVESSLLDGHYMPETNG